MSLHQKLGTSDMLLKASKLGLHLFVGNNHCWTRGQLLRYRPRLWKGETQVFRGERPTLAQTVLPNYRFPVGLALFLRGVWSNQEAYLRETACAQGDCCRTGTECHRHHRCMALKGGRQEEALRGPGAGQLNSNRLYSR